MENLGVQGHSKHNKGKIQQAQCQCHTKLRNA